MSYVKEQQGQEAIVDACDLLFPLLIPYFLSPQPEAQLAGVFYWMG